MQVRDSWICSTMFILSSYFLLHRHIGHIMNSRVYTCKLVILGFDSR